MNASTLINTRTAMTAAVSIAVGVTLMACGGGGGGGGIADQR